MAEQLNPLLASQMLNPLVSDSPVNPLIRTDRGAPSLGSVGNHDDWSAFNDRAHKLGANLSAIGSVIGQTANDAIWGKNIGTQYYDGSVAKSLLEARADINYKPSAGIRNMSSEFKKGNYGSAILEGAKNIDELVASSTPDMIGYGLAGTAAVAALPEVGIGLGLTVAGVGATAVKQLLGTASYMVENAEARKEHLASQESLTKVLAEEIQPVKLYQPNDVHHVIDGDTVVMNDGVHIRIGDIQAPEVNHSFGNKPHFDDRAGQQSKTFLENYINMAKDGKTSMVITNSGKDGTHGRFLGNIWSNGDNVGQQAIEQGMATAWIDKNGDADRNYLKAKKEIDARTAGVGLYKDFAQELADRSFADGVKPPEERYSRPTAKELFNLENISSASVQAALDVVGFDRTVKGFSNIRARALFSKEGSIKAALDTAHSFAVEGLTEAAQQISGDVYAKTGLDLLSHPVDGGKSMDSNMLYDSLSAGVLGGLSGGAMSGAGSMVPSGIKDVKNKISEVIEKSTASNEANKAYDEHVSSLKPTFFKDMTEQDKQDYKDNWQVDYQIDKELEKSTSTITANKDNGVKINAIAKDGSALSYDLVSDEVTKIDPTTKEVSVASEIAPEQKSEIKKTAVLKTVMELDTVEDLSGQIAMWKELGFDTDSDSEVRDIINSKQIENQARQDVLEAVEEHKSLFETSHGEKSTTMINTNLTNEIASANATKLQNMLKNPLMFGGTVENRLKRITSKWETNNMSQAKAEAVTSFMQQEKNYAIARFNMLEMSKPVEARRTVESIVPVVKQATMINTEPNISNEIKSEFINTAHNTVFKHDTAKDTHSLIDSVGNEDSFSEALKTASGINDTSVFEKRIGSKLKDKHSISNMEKHFKDLFHGVKDGMNTMVKYFASEKYKAGINADSKFGNKLAYLAIGEVVDGTNRIVQFSDNLIEKSALIGIDYAMTATSLGETEKDSKFLDSFFGEDIVNKNEALKFGGFSGNLAALDLGERIMKASGISFADTFNKREADEIKAHLGYLALESLVKSGYIDTAIIEADGGKSLRLYKYTDKSKQISVYSKVLDGYISKDIANRPIVSATKPIPISDKIANTSLKINHKQKRALSKLQEKKYKINSEMFDAIYDAVTTNDELDMAKVDALLHLQSDEEIDNIHINFRGNAYQKRNSSRLQFQKSFDFFTSIDPEETFQYQYYISSNGRAMTDSSGGGDYQQDKHFSRFVIDNVDSEGTTSEVNSNNKSEFIFGVLQGLEPFLEANDEVFGKFKGVDKATPKMNQTLFNKIIVEMKNKNGLFKDYLSGNYTADNLAKINGVHGLRAMKELVKYHNNFTSNGSLKSSFQSDIMFEADGITNGLSHQILQSMVGTNPSKFSLQNDIIPIFEKVGIFSKSNTTAQEFNNGAEAKFDTYTTVAMKVNEIVSKLNNSASKIVTDLFGKKNEDGSIKEIITRAIAKSPVMIFQYGASKEAIAKNIGELITKTLIEKIIDGSIDQPKLKDVKNAKGYLVFNNISKDTFIGSKQYDNMVNFFSEEIGTKFGESMETMFPTITNYQQSAQEGSSLIREALVNTKEYKDLIAKLNDSTVSILEYKKTLEAINKLIPNYATPWGDNQLQSHKLYKEFEPNENAKKLKLFNGKELTFSFNHKIEGIIDDNFYGEDKYSAFKGGDKSRAVMMTHHTDGYIMNADEMVDDFSMQVFDAAITRVGKMDKFAKDYNQLFTQINTTFSSFESIVKTVDSFSKSGLSISPDIKAKMDSYLTEKYNDLVASMPVIKQAISNIRSVNQMSGFGEGSFNITPEMRKSLIQNVDNRMNAIKRSRTISANKIGSKDTKIKNQTIISESPIVHSAEAIQETFDGLAVYGETSNASVLSSLITKLSKSLGKPIADRLEILKISKNDIETLGEFDAMLGNITVSVSDNIVSTQNQTAQEVYVHELVHKATEYALRGDKLLEAKVSELMSKAKQAMDNVGGYEYFLNFNPLGQMSLVIDEATEVAEAKKMYDYIFTRTNEFVAYGLTNPAFSKFLSDITVEKKQATSLLEAISMLFDKIVDKLSSLFGQENPKGFTMYSQLNDISMKLFAVNKKHEAPSAYKANAAIEILDKFDSMVEGKASEMISEALDKTKKMQDAVNGVMNTRLGQIVKENKIVRSIANEVVGESSRLKGVVKLMRAKEVYQGLYNDTRHRLATIIKEHLPADNIQDSALKIGLVDTDIQSLNMNAKEIQELLSSEIVLNKKIAEVESDIKSKTKSAGYLNYILNQAEGLGLYLGRNVVGLKSGQMMNSKNIVDALYYNGETLFTKNGSTVTESDVEALVSLYALKYTPNKVKSVVASYIDEHEDGVNELIGMLKSNVETSKKKLFKGEEHLYMSGFSNDMFSRDIETRVVPINEAADLVKEGFKPVVNMSGHDGQKIMMQRFNPEVKFSEGIMDTEQQSKKGTGSYAPEDVNPDMSYMTQRIKNIGLAKAGQYMMPLVDRKEKGRIASYRYVASKETKLRYLKQDNKLSSVLPDTMALTTRKLAGITNNRSLANQLVKMMVSDMPSNKKDYVPISLNSENTSTEYKMIPSDMKRELNKLLYGKKLGKTLYVHKDLIDNVFGYKNVSIIGMKFLRDRPKMQQIARIGEKLWQDVVSHVREAVVFKTPAVVIGNIVSNTIMLIVRGMNPITAIKYMNEGRMMMNKYRTDSDAMKRLEIKRDAGLSYDKVEHIRLKRAIDANPVKILIRSGQFQAIVDDVDIELDDKDNMLENFTSHLVEKLPKPIQTMLDVLYMNKNTKVFQFMMKTVQYSDFVGKYAFYKHMVTDKGMTSETAINEVEGMFINYSLLQNRWIKAASDNGGFMYTKYLLRIQRQIARSFHKNSSRTIASIGMQKVLGDVSDITDSFLPASLMKRQFSTSISDLSDPHLLEWIGIGH